MITTIHLLGVGITNEQTLTGRGSKMIHETYEYEHWQYNQMFKEASHNQHEHEDRIQLLYQLDSILKDTRGNAVNQVSSSWGCFTLKIIKTWF